MSDDVDDVVIATVTIPASGMGPNGVISFRWALMHDACDPIGELKRVSDQDLAVHAAISVRRPDDRRLGTAQYFGDDE